MNEYQEKITSGRFSLQWEHCDVYYLYEENKPIAQASWSEFQKLARGILKDEIDGYEQEIEELETDRDYWRTAFKSYK